MTSEFVVLIAGLREATQEGHCPHELETAGPLDCSRFNQCVCLVRTTSAPEGWRATRSGVFLKKGAEEDPFRD